MTLYCKSCNVLRNVDLDDFLFSKKKNVVCGYCGSVLITLEEVFEDLAYYNELYGWVV